MGFFSSLSTAFNLCYTSGMEIEAGIPEMKSAVLVGTRVSPKTRDLFAKVARSNNRSASGELRILIERHLSMHEDESA